MELPILEVVTDKFKVSVATPSTVYALIENCVYRVHALAAPKPVCGFEGLARVGPDYQRQTGRTGAC